MQKTPIDIMKIVADSVVEKKPQKKWQDPRLQDFYLSKAILKNVTEQFAKRLFSYSEKNPEEQYAEQQNFLNHINDLSMYATHLHDAYPEESEFLEKEIKNKIYRFKKNENSFETTLELFFIDYCDLLRPREKKQLYKTFKIG